MAANRHSHLMGDGSVGGTKSMTSRALSRPPITLRLEVVWARGLLACYFDRISAALVACASAKTRQSSKCEMSSAPATADASTKNPLT
jgi:hypothetical protein